MPIANELMLDISQSVEIEANLTDTYQALIRRLTSENSSPNNVPMPMALEEWPGGRWFRDLGEDRGHLWGFVQVIKPPTLIEIQGPMFMSYPVASHLQLRLTESSTGVDLSLRHQVLGAVTEEHRSGMVQGWGYMLTMVKQLSESQAAPKVTR